MLNRKERITNSTPITMTGKTQKFSSTTESKLRLSVNNVLSSPYEDLNIKNELLHEFVWRDIERWPNKTAVVCSTTGKSYTYSQLRKLSGKFATSLRKYKLNPGSTIAIVIPNIPESTIIIMGASEAGIKVSSSNPVYTAKEIGRQIINSDALAVITTLEQYPVVKESITQNPKIKLPIILVDDTNDSIPNGTIRFSELISDSVEEFRESPNPNKNNKDTMLISYTSGTTGLAKGAELSHRNIAGNCQQLQAEGVYAGCKTTATHQDVVPVIVPIFHIFGINVVVINFLSLGAKLVFLRKFSPDGAVKCLKDFRPNLLYAAPPVLLFLGNSELVTQDHLKSMKFILTGATPIRAESLQPLRAKANPNLVIAQSYALAEASPVVTASNNGMDNLNAVGYPVSNTQVRVVGIDQHNIGRNLGVNETGELYVKGPQVMKGYYKNPEATANAMDGDWFKTGDIGCYDNSGHIFIKDRLNELIKVEGYQVSPAELEELLRSNADILDAAVIAESHSQYGEIPKAFVVQKSEGKLDEDTVKNFIAKRVPKYKQLGSVKFIDAIPKNSSGKILKQDLKAL